VGKSDGRKALSHLELRKKEEGERDILAQSGAPKMHVKQERREELFGPMERNPRPMWEWKTLFGPIANYRTKNLRERFNLSDT